jgi:hypothetical protein
MPKFIIWINTILAAIFLFAGSSAIAQNNDPFGNRSQADTSVSYKPPAVYVTKINLEPTATSNQVKGKFMVWNNEKEVIGDLLYRIDLLDPLPKADPESGNVEDNAAIYDRFVSTNKFSLLPNERKEFSFTYNPPSTLPGGNYRIQITATNSRGRDMGWWDADVQLPVQKINFIKLITGPLISPEYPDRTFPAQAGPNISPEKSFNLNITAQNDSATDLKVTPILYLYEFDVARGLLDTINGKAISVPAHQKKTISFPVIAAKVPRVYYGILVLKDAASGKQLSNLAEYRWVVKGEHAEVLAMRVVKTATGKGQAAIIRVDLVGSADAITKTKVDLNVAVKDKQGTAGNIDVKGVELGDGVYTTQGPITLARDLEENKVIVATLKNQLGKEIDIYSIPLDFNAATLKTWTNTGILQIGFGIIAVGIVLVFVSKIFFKKKQRFQVK